MSLLTWPPDADLDLDCDLPFEASLCRDSFVTFVHTFWDQVPGAGKLEWNWHMDVLCQELEVVAKRVFRWEQRQYDTVYNVSPGTSKSTLCSILFPCWTWVNMPTARHITASHTEVLALDLASKSRDVIKGDLYRAMFPHIHIHRDSAGYYTNTAGGDRFTCTVGGKSPMGMHAHFLICLPYESGIMTDRGTLPIGRVVEERIPVRVLAYDHTTASMRWQRIEAYEKNPGRCLVRIVFRDGSALRVTEDHLVYVVGRGYTPACSMQPGDEVIHAVQVPSLRGSVQPFSSARCQDQIRTAFLLSQVPRSVHERSQPSSLCQRSEEVSRLWRPHFGGAWQVEDQQILFQEMSRRRLPWWKSLEVSEETEDRLRCLWQNHSHLPTRRGQEALLFQGLRQQGSLQEDDWTGEFQLHPRSWLWPLHLRFHGVEEKDQETGEVLLLPVRCSPEDVGPSFGNSPHRLGEVQRQEMESGGIVSELSSPTTRQDSPPFHEGQKVVASVEREVRIPEATYNVRVVQDHNYFAEGVLVHNCDDPIDPKKALSQLELKTASAFMTTVLPSRKVNKKVSVTFLIMQRLHEEDPSGVMLANGNREGAVKVRHICLPAELADNVSPPELREKYLPSGLMDPNRLGKVELGEFKVALGSYGYAGQFGQAPAPLGGSMFKVTFFTNRVKASPYVARRVRFWDRASVEGGGCWTAGVLMAMDETGNYFVEHVVRGQWEPYERDEHILAAAQRDRDRYGPNHEPIIFIEHEPGSSGVDAYRHTARKLAGYTVRPDRPSGDKVNRAEPWSSQCAAKNVYLVEDGTWDIQEWIKEHCLFPNGKYMDQVDASAAAFMRLLVQRRELALRTINIKKTGGVKGKLHILVCSSQLLSTFVMDQPSLLLSLQDPPVNGEVLSLPGHGALRLTDSHISTFPDLDPSEVQDRWQQPIPPWNTTPDKLVMPPEQGKKIWAFLLKKREDNPISLIIQDSGDRRALSAARAIADVLRLPRSVIHDAADPEAKHDSDAPNKHVYNVLRSSRSLVM